MSSHSSSPIRPTIVLASFQGADFIAEQIESIQAQTHEDWRLLVRDDGSDDATLSIIEAKAKGDERIRAIMDPDDDRGGINRNFSLALEAALATDAQWIALCDQDDFWLPDKLERQLALVAERGFATARPTLIHSDASVVDARLETIDPSLFRFMGLRHEEEHPLATLLVQNFVTGCTCLVNRALLEVALPVPPDCVMYDWWLALCAAATGQLFFDPEPTLLYRQHAGNALGAKSVRATLRRVVRRTLAMQRHEPREFMDTLQQAALLERRLAETGGGESDRSQIDESIEFVSDYLSLYRGAPSRVHRVLELHRRKIGRQDPFLDAMLKLRLLTRRLDASQLQKRLGVNPDLTLGPDSDPPRVREPARDSS